MEVLDNFLEQDYFDHLLKIIAQPIFPWTYQHEVANHGEEDDLLNFYFVHKIYDEQTFRPVSSLMDELEPLIKALEVKSLLRARVLMYTNTGKLIEHEEHVDYVFPHKAAVLYMNDNNGFTGFKDGTKVESVANRVSIFDGSTPHNSSTCTDDKVRVVLSINYF